MCQSTGEYPAVRLRIGLLLGYQTDILSWVSEGFAVVLERAGSLGRWCGCMSWGTWNQTNEALLLETQL